MMKPTISRSTGMLFGLIVMGLVYSSLLHSHARLTGIHQMDGILGVLLGLFTCAQPAANVPDIILYGRYLTTQPDRKDQVRWWLLNILVLVVGWWVIVTSLLRYSALN